MSGTLRRQKQSVVQILCQAWSYLQVFVESATQSKQLSRPLSVLLDLRWSTASRKPSWTAWWLMEEPHTVLRP